jgi:arginyl-tRNA synthetase
MDPKDALRKILERRIDQLGYKEKAIISYDRELSYADLTTPVAMSIASRLKRNPLSIAEEIIDGLKLPVSISAVGIVRPGFINFTLSDGYLLQTVARKPKTNIIKQRVLVEYSSPNIAKPFGVGHMRSTIIGDAVANLYEYLGYDVVRVNHLGDWGTQFGKLLYAYKTWGDDKKLEKNPIDEMLALYVKFHSVAEIDPMLDNRGREWFKKLENGDKEAKVIWHKFVKWSLKEFQRIYKILGVKFDKILGESFYDPMLADCLALVKKHGLTQESEGALVVRFPRDEMPPALLRKSDGTSLYMTRDLTALRYRLTTMKADTVIYHTGDEQNLHFRQLFGMAEMLGWSKKKTLIHAQHGLVSLPEGKMSTRKGRVVKLDDLIKEAIDRAYVVVGHKNSKLTKAQKIKVATVVGVGAIKYNDLANHRRTAVVFDWNKMLSLAGNSAPYLQYAYARLRSIMVKTSTKPKLDKLQAEDTRLLRKVIQFDDVVSEAAMTQAPNLLARYLFELANDYSAYYEKYPVLKTDQATRQHRLAIIKLGAETIKKGLNLLGIEVLERI